MSPEAFSKTFLVYFVFYFELCYKCVRHLLRTVKILKTLREVSDTWGGAPGLEWKAVFSACGAFTLTGK